MASPWPASPVLAFLLKRARRLRWTRHFPPWFSPFHTCFRHQAQHRWIPIYVHGLCIADHRKSLQRLAAQSRHHAPILSGCGPLKVREPWTQSSYERGMLYLPVQVLFALGCRVDEVKVSSARARCPIKWVFVRGNVVRWPDPGQLGWIWSPVAGIGERPAD